MVAESRIPKEVTSLRSISWTIVTTDASKAGWGAHCEGQVVHGRIGLSRQGYGLQCAEDMSSLFGSLRHRIKNRSVTLQMDNSAAVAYIQHQGGTCSNTLMNEVEPIMAWAEVH